MDHNEENDYPSEFYATSQVAYPDFYSPQVFDNNEQQIVAPFFNNEMQPAPQAYHEEYSPQHMQLMAPPPSGIVSTTTLSPAIQPGVVTHNPAALSRVATRQQQSANQRQKSRAKTPWTMDENRSLFCAMAEYIHIDQFGIKPLAIYLNPAELNFVEACETKHQLMDIDIAKSLRERELDSNPNRRSDLLFEVLRHMQQASGNHSTRVVNEKVKNARSRIVNWFMTMFTNGMLPTKRPVRYVTAILTSLVASPFCPLEDVLTSPEFATYVNNDAKHDVDLWLQAMFWLHPRRMYSFIYQCAIQITRAQAEKTMPEMRTELDCHLLSSQQAPHPWVVYESLRALDLQLRSSTGGSNSRDMYKDLGYANMLHDDHDYQPNEGSGRKRKRRLQVQDSRKVMKGVGMVSDNVSSYVITSGADVNESLKMFDIMKNEEKVRMAGQRVKLVAAVGGVIRRDHSMSILDARYHLYRLWTCVSRFQDISSFFTPTRAGELQGAAFSELVVVHDFMNTFEEANIEPHIRVAQLRVSCTGSLESLVTQYVGSTDGETREEIPIWLAVVAKANGSHALALIVCSPVIEPSTSTGSSLLSYRQFGDTELTAVMTGSIIESHGTSNSIGDSLVCNIGGLEPWPHSSKVTMSHGQVSQVKVGTSMSDNKSQQLVVSSLFNGFKGVLDPWCEPRILSIVAYAMLQEYASTDGNGPSYQTLSNDTLAISANIPESAATKMLVHESSMHHFGGLVMEQPSTQYPNVGGAVVTNAYMNFANPAPDGMYEAQMSGLVTRNQSPMLHAHQMSSDATVSAAAAAAAAGLELITPFMSPALGSTLLKDEHVGILNEYNPNAWDSTSFNVDGTYPEFINNNEANDIPK
ncbi:hypothetical protein IW140_002118 [Coemansia sp. RSA 1813]|nr:hypothetical protein EV178_001267 [Coemansia sp. RSA 1646]KAJ2213863.1 hypothetical protein EV179_003447 [Coemansia sp. RSA 487]KAJ2570692.1 hypothetical protein IW140_002118 [Coemansia sp. RSA 1813]